ncbi:hypothetical protein [Hymenobacter sp. BRD67]|uniref:hypothetical protein n=1 Tax=Hymenobacter sp. BRD67 TaxID=2675877 RepID=UPI0020B68C9A|nr:hypothetical protein [Hymenobacter sp. BRD67]
MQLQAEVAANQELSADQSNALLRRVGDYARALDVLDQYDHQRLLVARDRPDGSRRLADNALVALTLLIAESRPEDKDVMATLVVNLINDEN